MTRINDPSKPLPAAAVDRERRLRRPAQTARSARSVFAQGEPMIWLTGGGLVVALMMIAALLALVLIQGVATFWPGSVVQVHTPAGVFMGEVTRGEFYTPASVWRSTAAQQQEPSNEPPPATTPQPASDLALDEETAIVDQADAIEPEDVDAERQLYRRLFRTGNYELTGTHFHWISDAAVDEQTLPPWALVVERLTDGRFYGTPQRFLIGGQPVAETPDRAWQFFQEHFPDIVQRRREIRRIESRDKGRLNSREEAARLRAIAAALRHGEGSSRHLEAEQLLQQVRDEVNARHAELNELVAGLSSHNDRYVLELVTAQGDVVPMPVAQIVRAYPANRLGVRDKLRVYVSRWWEFLTDEPRHANSEGGVFPAIFGTVLMTLVMSIAVVPFGVLAALYLREYAKAGPVISAVRIAINNLAGVPSIVFGVFGLGFFAYIVGAGIDELFFQAKLSEGRPTFGTGGLLWASLTLALLTLPVVIVATEEALAAVPLSMREGAYACGASKWQTIRRIVLPRAMPGVMTGMILAMARGAGEVAPLMLVGAVKLAPELPGRVDGVAPFIHVESSFMHLGFHIYDLGFQSQNAEAAKAMVYTTTLLLIAIVVMLNITAMLIRNRLRRRYAAGQF